MGILISSSDFKGKYAIPQSVFSDLDDFIIDNEEAYLIELFGAELWRTIKATITGSPPKPIGAGYLNVYNPFFLDGNNEVVRSKGLVIMLVGFMFFDFMRQIGYSATSQGMVINAPDTSKKVDSGTLYQYLNEAVATYRAIQYYVNSAHPELFPPEIAPTDVNFNGQCKGYSNSVLG